MKSEETDGEPLLTDEDLCRLLRVPPDAPRALRTREDDPLPHIHDGERFLYERQKVMAWARRAQMG